VTSSPSKQPFVDPYIDPATGILFNLVGATTQQQLESAEYRYTWTRRQELATDPVAGNYDLAHLQETHRRLFQDVYTWAGQLRIVDISKNGSAFHPITMISEAADYTFGYVHESSLLSSDISDATFIEQASELLSRINYIHPFREGNGRAQRAFIDQIAAISHRFLSWRNVSKEENTRASIESFDQASGQPFRALLGKALKPPRDGFGVLDDNLYKTSAPLLPPSAVHDGAHPYAPPVIPELTSKSFCGSITLKGQPCMRRGHCPYHGGAR